MSEVVHDVQQEFWRPPAVTHAVEASLSSVPSPAAALASVCRGCDTEFMIAARFCHACGARRGLLHPSDLAEISGGRWLGLEQLWTRTVEMVSDGMLRAASACGRASFPAWLKYLHFHEIKRWVGLPTGSLIAFLIGLGCVAGALAISLFYRATNLAEFQAIQMWRMEWLLAATASFVAGILLRSPSDGEHK
jgi:hypothetical protein